MIGTTPAFDQVRSKYTIANTGKTRINVIIGAKIRANVGYRYATNANPPAKTKEIANAINTRKNVAPSDFQNAPFIKQAKNSFTDVENGGTILSFPTIAHTTSHKQTRKASAIAVCHTFFQIVLFIFYLSTKPIKTIARDYRLIVNPLCNRQKAFRFRFTNFRQFKAHARASNYFAV